MLVASPCCNFLISHPAAWSSEREASRPGSPNPKPSENLGTRRQKGKFIRVHPAQLQGYQAQTAGDWGCFAIEEMFSMMIYSVGRAY